MKKITGRMDAFVLITSIAMSVASQWAAAWNPPDGDRPDHAYGPATPTTLVRQAHGYITQNGITILYNDGYWFAAQYLRESQQELLNGVRAADRIFGDQVLRFQVCVPVIGLIDLLCHDVGLGVIEDLLGVTLMGKWPYAADKHYYNPGTMKGLDTGTVKQTLNVVTTSLGFYLLGTVKYQVDPPLKLGTYDSAIDLFKTKYEIAVRAGQGLSTSDPDIQNRKGVQNREGVKLAMFDLGWASHLLQDLNVVHHTFDAFDKHHSEYERFADGLIKSPPPINGQKQGTYMADLPTVDLVGCDSGKPSCLLAYAAKVSHNSAVLDAADDEDYTAAGDAVSRAQKLQAGLYAAFLTDIGRRPVHMSAIVATF